VEVLAPLTGVIAAVLAQDGMAVSKGAAVLLVESMKMHHEVQAPIDGVVESLAVGAGDQIEEGQPLFAMRAERVTVPVAHDHVELPDPEAGVDSMRADLREVLDRRCAITDEGRPDAVKRRRALARRTARENIAALCDEGSFSEYGGLTLAAQRARRELGELIEKTPADGIVTGIGAVNAEQFGAPRARCVVMSYDYTVLAGTQGIRNHRKTDRMLELARSERMPVVLFAEGGGGRP
jgi:pyruvate/2-oxoglutarate dehydrogenase complex dihydrolipoamide acyltransferase (E2) component